MLLKTKMLLGLAITTGLSYALYSVSSVISEHLEQRDKDRQAVKELHETVSTLNAHIEHYKSANEQLEKVSDLLEKQLSINERSMSDFVKFEAAQEEQKQSTLNMLNKISNEAKNEDCINSNLPDNVMRLLINSATRYSY